jgi:3D (Asp-Asp-Asp) domain-containing protein
MFSKIILITFLLFATFGGESYTATAYSLKGKTASGKIARRGIIAADPKILPLGTRVKITESGGYDGVYTVADTGGRIKGRKVDIWIPSQKDARKFGRRIVKLSRLTK